MDSAPAVHIDDVYITGILRQVEEKFFLRIFESFQETNVTLSKNHRKLYRKFESFQETNVSLSMLSTNPLFHTSFFRDVLAQCRYINFIHTPERLQQTSYREEG